MTDILRDDVKRTLNGFIDFSGVTIDDLKSIIRELESDMKPNRKGGRPLGVGNNESQLIDQIEGIRQRLGAKDKRTDIAASFGVSRQTLHTFIVEHLPEYHKAK